MAVLRYSFPLPDNRGNGNAQVVPHAVYGAVHGAANEVPLGYVSSSPKQEIVQRSHASTNQNDAVIREPDST